jgi:hypothetical protein
MSLMFLPIWRFITFLLAALTLAMAFCHLLEMLPKMKYDAAVHNTPADALSQLWSSSRCGDGTREVTALDIGFIGGDP